MLGSQWFTTPHAHWESHRTSEQKARGRRVARGGEWRLGEEKSRRGERGRGKEK